MMAKTVRPIVGAKLADITPVCACRGYVEAGDRLRIQSGQDGQRRAWWVACPDCGSAIGQSWDYPVIASDAAIEKRLAAK